LSLVGELPVKKFILPPEIDHSADPRSRRDSLDQVEEVVPSNRSSYWAIPTAALIVIRKIENIFKCLFITLIFA
jgi:hypothetical protein